MVQLSALQLAQELIRINSINPKCLSEWAKMGSEKNVADWLVNYLQPFGFQCQFLPADASRPNLIVRHNTFNPDLPTLAFEAHMDTVDVEGMTIDPFEGEIRNQRLYGRGACDVKGTMAAMIYSIIDWYGKIQNKSRFNTILIGCMGEEAGTVGSRFVASQKIPLDMILVAEPTMLNPVIGHKGLWRFSIETIGRSGHSSHPEDGVNAIQDMIEVICILLNDVKPQFEKHKGNIMSLTTLHGGSAINMIPDHCLLEVDCRYSPDTDIQNQRQYLFQALKSMQDILQKKVKVTELDVRSPYQVKSNSLLLKILQNTLTKTGITHQPLIESWYSDAGNFGIAGYDAIVWGAGDIAQSHTADEYLTLEQLQSAVAVLQEFLVQCERVLTVQ